MQPNDQPTSQAGPTIEPPKEDTSAEALTQNTEVPSMETRADALDEPTQPHVGSVIGGDAAPEVSQPVSTVPGSVEAPAGITAAPIAATTGAGLAKAGRKKKLWLIIGIIGLVVILGGGAAAAYVGLILPKQPQRIAQDALSNTINKEKFKSSHFEGDVSFSGGDITKTLSGVTFDGASSETNAFDIKFNINTTVTKVGLDARSVDGKEFYLRLSGIDKILSSYVGAGGAAESAALVTQLAPIISKINNQWYSIDSSLLGQFGSTLSVTDQTKVTEDDAKKIGEIYKKHQFLNVDKKLGDQDIHGVASYHIQSSIDNEKLKAFLAELKDSKIAGLTLEQSTLDQVTKVDFTKYPFEMWVSKSGHLVTQLATTVVEDGTTVKARIAFYDINKTVTVEKPSDAKSILELLSEFAPLYGGLLGSDGSADSL